MSIESGPSEEQSAAATGVLELVAGLETVSVGAHGTIGDAATDAHDIAVRIPTGMRQEIDISRGQLADFGFAMLFGVGVALAIDGVRRMRALGRNQ